VSSTLGQPRSLRATIAYDGTDFSGFQIQRSRQDPSKVAPRTVQGTLEDALAQILQKPTPLLAAGRTDSGVHAVGQVIAFAAHWTRPLNDLHRALNAVLPKDVAVLALSDASSGFHPRYDALSRTYRYTVWNHPVRNPLFRRRVFWVRRPLDLAAMNEAAQLLVGSQDFATFGTAPRSTPRRGAPQSGKRSGDPAAPLTVRRVIRAAWVRAGEQACGIALSRTATEAPDESAWQGLVEFTIEANAFLYRMVRSIVGTLIQVGLGDCSVCEFASALNATDRALAGPTAPPQGLCLIQVRYTNDADTEYRTEYRSGYRQENQ